MFSGTVSKYCGLHGNQGRRCADWANIRLWRNAEQVPSAERHKGRIIENRFFDSVLGGCTVALHLMTPWYQKVQNPQPPRRAQRASSTGKAEGGVCPPEGFLCRWLRRLLHIG